MASSSDLDRLVDLSDELSIYVSTVVHYAQVVTDAQGSDNFHTVVGTVKYLRMLDSFHGCSNWTSAIFGWHLISVALSSSLLPAMMNPFDLSCIVVGLPHEPGLVAGSLFLLPQISSHSPTSMLEGHHERSSE